MSGSVALFVTRIFENWKGTVFSAIDVVAPGQDSDLKATHGFLIIGEFGVTGVGDAEISKVHSAKHGFLYKIESDIGLSEGMLLTNIGGIAGYAATRKVFSLRTSSGESLGIAEEDLPEVIRGAGFFGICVSAEDESCGIFFVRSDLHSKVSGRVSIDGLECPDEIHIYT